jgi:hypothetical protein
VATPAHPAASPAPRATVALTAAVVAAAAVGGGLADAHPTGLALVDPVLAGAWAAVLALAGRRTAAWSLFPLLAGAVAFASPPVGLACALLGLVAAVWAYLGWRPVSPMGAVAAGLGAQALLRLDVPGALGLDSLLALAVAVPLLVSAHRAGTPPERRRRRRVVLALGLACLVVAGAGVAGALRARSGVDRGTEQIQAGLRAAREGDSEAAAGALSLASRSFARAHDDLTSWWSAPAGALPLVGPNLRALADVTDLAADLTEVGSGGLAETAAADLVVRKGRVPIDAFAGLEDPLLRVESGLVEAQRRLARPASTWQLGAVRTRLADLVDKIDSARHDAEVALTAVRTLPDVFGAGGQRRYLALFVTPVEGRSSGFPGNFAELVLTDGEMEMTRFGRIGELDRLPGVVGVMMPEEYERRYRRFGDADSWRSITLTPDFPTVAELVRQLYPQSGGAELDGVMSVDPAALGALLRLTGPVAVPGVRKPLTARNAEEFLLRDQYIELPDTPDRVDALESLGRGTFDALLERDLPRPQEIARVLSPAFDEQHLRFVSFDEEAEGFFDEIGVTGALLPVRGDALAITTNNLVGNKIDLFLQRSVDYDVEWDPVTRTVRSVLRIHLVNGAPSAGLPDYVIGSALPTDEAPPKGTNRTYLSVFTPLGLEEARLDGRPISIEVQSEAGRSVYSTFLDLAPDGGEATIELVLAGPIVGGSSYRLDVAPQVMARPDLLHVRVRRGATTVLDVPEHEVRSRETFAE